VDLARACYRTKCRFFKDSDVETEIEWYFVPDGTPFLPFSHVIGCDNWQSDKFNWRGPGEVDFSPRPFVQGSTKPSALARNVCGSAEEWAEGLNWPATGPPVEYDPFGIPTCCAGATVPWVGDGGLEFDGNAPWSTNAPTIGDGGLEVNGAVLIETNSWAVGNGGLEFDGFAPYATNAPQIGDGGLEVNGAVLIETNSWAVGNGGLEFDGFAPYATNAPQIGDGGLEWNGFALWETNSP